MCILIIFCKIQDFEDDLMTIINEIAQLLLNIEESYQLNVYFYIIFKLSECDMIFETLWISQQHINVIMSDEELKLVFKNFEIVVFSKYEKKWCKASIKQISAAAFNM